MRLTAHLVKEQKLLLSTFPSPNFLEKNLVPRESATARRAANHNDFAARLVMIPYFVQGATGMFVTLLKVLPLAIYLRSAACKFDIPVLGCDTEVGCSRACKHVAKLDPLA